MRAYLFVYIVILFLFGGVESKVRFNSQYETPHGIRLADITGDGISGMLSSFPSSFLFIFFVIFFYSLLLIGIIKKNLWFWMETRYM